MPPLALRVPKAFLDLLSLFVRDREVDLAIAATEAEE